MNDVLRRLALRVLPGAGDIVRPRLRSRFEGRPGPAEAPGGDLAPPRPGASAPAAAAASPPLSAAAAARKATPALVTPAAVPALQEAKPAAAKRSAVATAPDLPAPSSDPIAPEPPSIIAGSDAAATGAATAAAAAAAPGSAEMAAGAPTLPAHPQAETGHEREQRPPHLLLPEMRLPETPDAPVAGDAPGRGGALPPDIRISIGRIDVRAGGEPRPTPPPRPRARSRPTLMSLEDYLGKGRSRP